MLRWADWTISNCKIIIQYAITEEVMENYTNNTQDDNYTRWMHSFDELTYFDIEYSFWTDTLHNVYIGTFVRKKTVFRFTLILVFNQFAEMFALFVSRH
jgi:hypothetical protein